MKKLVAVAAVLLLAASAQAAYYDAININLSDGGDGNVSGLTIYTAQSPAALGSNWNDLSAPGDTAWGSNGRWAGATIKTANGTSVTVTGDTPFNVGFYAEDFWNASAGLSTGNGSAATLPNVYWYGNAGSGGTDLSGGNVPFTQYDVYWMDGGGNWNQLGSYTAASFSGKIANSWSQGSVAAIQILSTNPADAAPEPATMSLLALGGWAVLLRRRKHRRG